jgi:hypothetical protein
MKKIVNDRGNALIITLMLLVILTGLGIYAISISTTEMGMAFQWKSGTVGFNAAESGIYQAYDNVGTNIPFSWPISGTLPNGATFSGGGAWTRYDPAIGFGTGYMYSIYTVTSTGNASGSTVQRNLQAEVQYGPVQAGPGYN